MILMETGVNFCYMSRSVVSALDFKFSCKLIFMANQLPVQCKDNVMKKALEVVPVSYSIQECLSWSAMNFRKALILFYYAIR